MGERSVIPVVCPDFCFEHPLSVCKAFHGRCVWFDLHIKGHKFCMSGNRQWCGFCSKLLGNDMSISVDAVAISTVRGDTDILELVVFDEPRIAQLSLMSWQTF